MTDLQKGEKIFNEIVDSINPRQIFMDGAKYYCCKETATKEEGEKSKKVKIKMVAKREEVYMCKQCSYVGTVINFYSKTYNISFYEAIKFLDEIGKKLFKGLTDNQIQRDIKSVKIYNDYLISEIDKSIFEF